MAEESRILIREIKTGLQTAASKIDILKWLTVIRALLNPEFRHNNSVYLSTWGYSFSSFQSIPDKDVDLHLKHILEILVSRFSLEWAEHLTTEGFNTHVKPLFLDQPRCDTFFVLFKAVTEPKRKDFAFHKCVLLLEEFLTRERLSTLLRDQCVPIQEELSSQVLNVEREMLISCLASLPDKAANVLQLEVSEAFLPKQYIPTLALSIFDACDWAQRLLCRGQDVSLGLVSGLVGKLCLTGQADLLLDTLLPQLCVKVRSDFIWCRICERVFTGAPARTLESIVIPLLKKLTWFGLVEKFLGDSVLHLPAINKLICTKLLLHRHYSKPKSFLQNIIGYLASFHTRRTLLLEVCLRLLRVWADSSSLRHTSAEQHRYISQALLVCIVNLNDEEKASIKEKMLQILMPGVQVHLESSDPTTMMLGMTVAKVLTEQVHSSGPKLEFELDLTNPAVLDLLSYTEKLPPDPGPSSHELDIMTITNKTTGEVDEGIRLMRLEEAAPTQTDLDSDDDLEPYDMSHDSKVQNVKPPKYVRDCMEGLISGSENPDLTDTCLQHAEQLIRKNPFGLIDIAAEFAKVLLHLQDSHSFDHFLGCRFKALVALAVYCPSQVVEYLTSQFYERNYSIRQRLDILEIMASAAQELARPEQTESDNRTKDPNPSVQTSLAAEPESWRDIVQKRIESNTRRFVRGPTRSVPQPKLNRFAPVAGQFFYPLMSQADKVEPFLDLLDKDTTLLFRLLYTLAVILYSAMNIPPAGQMGRALLEFTWPLRFHPDSSVRQAVLVATSSVFLVVPSFLLLSDFHRDVTETRSWLEDVIQQDPDTECQKWAAQTLLLLEDQIKKEIQSSKS